MRFLFSNMAISYIVNRAISAKAFPADSNGVYFVITDKGTTQKSLLGGFCSAYCGWHSFDTIKGKALKVSFVGHPGRCLKSCASPTISRKGGVSPNGDRAWTQWSPSWRTSSQRQHLTRTSARGQTPAAWRMRISAPGAMALWKRRTAEQTITSGVGMG
ncbi:hypothetical protein CLOM_g15289 [Closterium sp. NIES-68]|nr:hypothetical protein CLOM_g15289 [Closterium sp. NIES-68]